MKTVHLKLPRLHSAQQQIVNEAARFNVGNCGRRFGKTTLGIDLDIRPALDGYPVAWFSPTYKMLEEVWREFRRLLRPVTSEVNAQQHRIELITGGVLDMWSLDSPDIARGRKYARVVIDEAARVKDLEAAWNEVIRPTLTDYEGDAWFLSTPNGRNFYWVLYQRGQDASNPEWRSWQLPSSANPFLNPKEIESARRGVPERVYAQEYLAVFIEDGGGVFRRVRDAVDLSIDAEPVLKHTYVMGVDWGKHNDFTVFTVIDADMHALVAIDRFNQIDYSLQVGRLKALAKRYRPAMIVAERNSMGEPLIETLLKDGLPIHPFTTTNPTKAIAIESLALAFERGELRMIDDPVLLAEMEAFDAERLPSGMLRYSAPPGMHDDCVMSLALAWLPVSAPYDPDDTLIYSEPVSISPY